MTIQNVEIGTGRSGPLYGGDAADINISITDDDGDPLTLSGATVEFEIWGRIGRDRIELLDTDGIVEFTDAAAGEVKVPLNTSRTLDLQPDTGSIEYEFRVRVITGGQPDTVTTGLLVITAGTDEFSA